MALNDGLYYVQVRDKETGLEYPLPLERYHNDSDLWEVLDEQPVDPNTNIALPTKAKTSVDEEAAKKKSTKSGQSAASKKENS